MLRGLAGAGARGGGRFLLRGLLKWEFEAGGGGGEWVG